MLEKAKVTAIQGNMAKIMVIRNEMCGSCQACGIGKGEEVYMDVYNNVGAKEGDYVEVEMENSDFLSASLIMYGVPLLAFFIGIIIGYLAYPIFGFGKPNEVFAAALGFAMTVVSYLLIRYFEPRIKENKRFKPVIKYVVK